MILVLAFLFFVDTPIARLPYILRIQGFSVLLPSRLVSVIDLALPILAAFGFSHFQNQTNFALYWSRGKKYIPIALAVLLFLTAFDLIRQARKYNAFVPNSLVLSATESLDFLANQPIPSRVLITHPELFPVNTNLLYRIAMIDGYDSVHSKRMEELLAVLNDERVMSKNKEHGRVTFSANKNSLAINLLSPEYVYERTML